MRCKVRKKNEGINKQLEQGIEKEKSKESKVI